MTEPIKPTAPCRCKGTKYWLRTVNGKAWVCYLCHPPIDSNVEVYEVK